MLSDSISGVLQAGSRGDGFLRDPERSFQPLPNDVWVSPNLIKENHLVEGATVSGAAQRVNNRLELQSVQSVCGLSVQDFRNRTTFDRLVAVHPHQRFELGANQNVSMRIIDLIAPIGKGTRGLIVSPPKAGKTRLLEEIAVAIHVSEPEARIVVLLIDERPEEVTHFRRTVPAEVLASSADQSVESHVKLAELTLAHVRCEVECRRHIVILLDSLTRLARAFNQYGVGSRKTLSGGLDSRALEIPRRFFGLARNIENGGSVTVIATAMVNTGSRMDDYIYEEFKGTGNSEIVLDRSLAEVRIFPAINLIASSTRREELLYTETEISWLRTLRRWIADRDAKTSMQGLLRLIEASPDNQHLMQMPLSI